MNKFFAYLVVFGFFSQMVSAAPRYIDADGFKDPARTKTYNLPPITGTDSLATSTSTQTLTNKSIDGGGNTLTNIPLGSAVTGNLPFANLPAGGSSTTFLRGDGSWNTPTGGVWGQLTGTLSNQTDLQSALNADLKKANNLSDLTAPATARTNLGLGALATVTPGGTAAVNTFLNGSGNYAQALTPGQALTPANNLSDVSSVSTSRTNLGLGSLATITPTGTASSTTFLRGDGQWIAPTGSVWGNITGTLSNQTDLQTALNATAKTANNLSDLASASTARTNLGLGTLATQSPSGTANSGTFLSGANTYVPISKSNLNINYIGDTDAEGGTIGSWTAYANTASNVPTSGTGGSPTVSLTVNNAADMIGNWYYVFNHPASNTQGQGVSYLFNIDKSFATKTLQISFQYSLGSATGTYSGGSATTDSDLEVYLQDYLGNTIIQPAGFKLDCGAVQYTPCTFTGNFQASTYLTYRLIIHSATTTATAYQMRLDNIAVTPNIKTMGVPATDLVASGVNVITSTGTAPTKGTTSIDLTRWGRIGDHARIKGEYKQTAAGSSANGTGDYLFLMPNGMSFDSNKVNYYTTAGNPSVPATTLGSAQVNNNSVQGTGFVVPYDSTHFRIYVVYNQPGTTNPSAAYWGANAFGTNNAVMSASYDFEAPIAGWSSNVQMSDQSGDNRVIAASLYTTGTQTLSTTNTKVNLTSASVDTVGGLSNGQYVVASPGVYYISGKIGESGTANAQISAVIYKNGSSLSYGGSSSTNGTTFNQDSIVTPLVAGDVISLYAYGSSGGTSLGGSTNAHLDIFRLGGNTQTAIGESVNATYGLTTAQSVAANAVIKYDTKVNDSHNAFSTATGLFTCPVNGMYRVSQEGANSGGGTTYVKVNNVGVGFLATMPTSNYVYSGSLSTRCLAGQTIGIYSDSAATVVAPDATAGFRNQVTFERTGN